MKRLNWQIALLMISLVCGGIAQEAKSLYENDFQKGDLDKIPSDFMVIDGAFAVKQEGDNKFLELPGAPLDTYGTLFGPTEKEGLTVSARVFSTGKGRRFPTFAIGLNGVAGYKLQVSPGKKLLEIYKADGVKSSVPLEWLSGKWTYLKLKSEKSAGGKLTVHGKVWFEGSTEPSAWTVSFEDGEDVPSGRPSIWGSPFATTPIRFDDLRVTKP